MESNVLDENFKSATTQVGLNAESLDFLKQAGKWGKFLSIMGFIVCGIMAIGGLFAGQMIGNLASRSAPAGPVGIPNMGGFLSVFYVIIALIYFYPCLTLFRFSTHAIEAAGTGRSEHVTLALKNLKSNFKFVGILTIVILSFYVLVILFAVLATAMR